MSGDSLRLNGEGHQTPPCCGFGWNRKTYLAVTGVITILGFCLLGADKTAGGVIAGVSGGAFLAGAFGPSLLRKFNEMIMSAKTNSQTVTVLSENDCHTPLINAAITFLERLNNCFIQIGDQEYITKSNGILRHLTGQKTINADFSDETSAFNSRVE